MPAFTRREACAALGSGLAFLSAGCGATEQYRAGEDGRPTLTLAARGLQVEPAGILQGGSGLFRDASDERTDDIEAQFGMGATVGIDFDVGRRSKDDYVINGDVPREQVRQAFEEVGIPVNDIATMHYSGLGEVAERRLETIASYDRGFLPYGAISVRTGIGAGFVEFRSDMPRETVAAVREFLSVRGLVYLSLEGPNVPPDAVVEMTPLYGTVLMGYEAGTDRRWVEVEPARESRLLKRYGVHENPEAYTLRVFLDDGAEVATVQPTAETVALTDAVGSDEPVVSYTETVRLGPFSEARQRAVFAALHDGNTWPSTPRVTRTC